MNDVGIIDRSKHISGGFILIFTNEVLRVPVIGSWCLSIDAPLDSKLQGSVRAAGLLFNYGDLFALTLRPAGSH